MPTGLKQTSSLISVGFRITESAPNTFTQSSVDLNLSPLDREVFVVLSCDLTPFAPGNVPTLTTRTNVSVSSTRQTAVTDIDNSNCVAASVLSVIQDPAGALSPVSFQSDALDTPGSMLDYIAIIATNDFFVQVQGTNNIAAKGSAGRIYGYRAQASADIYAALVQSEVLSA